MKPTVQFVPAARRDLVIRPVGEGQYVVKQPGRGAYFRLGAAEHFLLGALDGRKSPEEVCAEFAREFRETLETEELQQFLDLARRQGLTEQPGDSSPSADSAERADHEDDETAAVKPGSFRGKGSLLFYRKPLCRPDRFFTWLESKLRFVWTPGFVMASAALMVAALAVVLESRGELASAFPSAMRWETLVVVWAALILATCLHECAHGLTCKHFGGEVPDAGVLLMLFMPCFYCNVSDAWLIPQKSRRLWVTAAGAYCDLCVGALAVFVWRVTVQDSLVNYVAFVVMGVCGTRSLLNLNPFLRLDGYYLLSDWLEIPNLRTRAGDHWMAHVRWMLWGAKRPQPVPRGRLLVAYGIFVWIVAVAFLDFVIFHIVDVVGGHSVLLGWSLAAILIFVAGKRVFRGFFASEFANMLRLRRRRTWIWIGVLVGLPALAFLIPMNRKATGEFLLRPTHRIEVRTPIAGFLRTVHGSEGDLVQAGEPLAEIGIPDLDSRIAQKQAELAESQANLRRLLTGTRPEELTEQRARVTRAEEWRDLGQRDLERARRAFAEELVRLDESIKQYQAELDLARTSYRHSQTLYEHRALAREQLLREINRVEILKSELAQAEARKRERLAEGTRLAEAELARREKELADARSRLKLLEAGSRPEEIAAETARSARVREELSFLEGQRQKLHINTPITGRIVTPRIGERINQYLPAGGAVCEIEDISTFDVEIALDEGQIGGVRPGQRVELKPRALPFETFSATVIRVAPRIGPPDQPQQPQAQPQPNSRRLVVYCRVENPDHLLHSGMTGHARIYKGERALATNLLSGLFRYVRTEFWW